MGDSGGAFGCEEVKVFCGGCASLKARCAACAEPRRRAEDRAANRVYNRGTSSGRTPQPARRSQLRSAARIAWCRLRCFDRAFASTSSHTAAGSRIERTTVLRVFPLPGWPRRRRMASGPSSGISHSARSEGPPRSPAPVNALRLTGPKRAKSTSSSSTSVVFVVVFFTFGRLSRADDANRVRRHFCMDNIEKTTTLRVADENESCLFELVRVVRGELVAERRLRLVERDPVLLKVSRGLLGVPLKPHDSIV
jgi:hypothetical protein